MKLCKKMVVLAFVMVFMASSVCFAGKIGRGGNFWDGIFGKKGEIKLQKLF